MTNSYYSQNELKRLGLCRVGKGVLISKKASIYQASKLSIGDNVRIDDFCILSGTITLHSHIHIAAGVYLFGGNAGITLESFTGISSHSCVYAVSDDFSGHSLVGPVISKNFKNIKESHVIMKKHSVLGTHCIVFPGLTIDTGCVIGATSLLTKSTKPWCIYFGTPAKKISSRSQALLSLEQPFLDTWNQQSNEAI